VKSTNYEAPYYLLHNFLHPPILHGPQEPVWTEWWRGRGLFQNQTLLIQPTA